MTAATNKPGAAARRFGQTSDELADALIIRGKAVLLDEHTLGANPEDGPTGLYQRSFELTYIDVLKGNVALIGNEGSLTFIGYTILPSAKRVEDTHNPTLHLDGQTFFDRKLSQSPKDVVLILGGSELAPKMGFMGKTATVETGPLQGSSVRAFLAEGADATLIEALPSLAGFHGQPTLAVATNATQASHPLVALDALRQAGRRGASDQVEVLARWLLHPSQPTCVKIVAVEILGEAIREAARCNNMPEVLVGVAVEAWEAERADPLYAAYLRTLYLATDHTSNPELLLKLEGLAVDSLFGELSALADELSDGLSKKTNKYQPPRTPDDQQSD